MTDRTPTAEQELWPPAHLPRELHAVATAADLIRHETDYYWDGGAGVCLGVSAFLSYILLDLEIGHSLANGVYRDEQGEHAHWWIETTSGWILDGSRGQFDHGEGYRPGVVQRMDPAYSLRSSMEPGHGDLALVEAELRRCFGDPAEAYEYLDLCEALWSEAQELMAGGNQS